MEVSSVCGCKIDDGAAARENTQSSLKERGSWHLIVIEGLESLIKEK